MEHVNQKPQKNERERERDLQCGDFSVRLLLAGAATFYHLLRVEIRILAFIDIAADGSPRSTEPITHTERESTGTHPWVLECRQNGHEVSPVLESCPPLRFFARKKRGGGRKHNAEPDIPRNVQFLP
jgi:hypothetical protein